MGATPSCRRHAERATPRNLTFGKKLVVALIQHIGYVKVNGALLNAAAFVESPCTRCT